ncbi:glycosyltransferase [Nocardioides aurantiacus]|uniref:glycosyltransferase n=1 Tax=Nocardioides aurantiacus TaxID=86796 RepID=UPI00403F13E9
MRSQRPLRVTFVVPDLGGGGAERHLATLVAGLDPALFTARVVCLGCEGELFEQVAATVPTRSLGHSKRQALRSVAELRRELRRTRPDVVVTRGYSAELVGRVAAVLARVPRNVVWVHNCGDSEGRGRARALSDRALQRFTHAYFGVAHAQQSYLVDDLGHPEDNVRIIHNGVDATLFDRPEQQASRDALRADLGLGPGAVAVGILAALRPEKDHELFLRAAVRVAERAPSARFVVVGEGARRPGLEKLADELGLGNRVVFTGFRTDVAELLQAVDVFVLCSYTVECFPMALLEAMASSRPAVCTAVGGVPEMVEEGVTGFLVPPRDDVSLARRLVQLVNDPELRVGMGAAGRRRVEREFTLEASVRGAERALLEVAGPEAPAAPPPVRLTVVMDETAVGGVEVVTLALFRALDPSVVRPRLVCLRGDGPLAEDFRTAGFEVESLGRRSWRDARTLPRLVQSLRRTSTDAVMVAHHHRASLVLARAAARLAGTRVTLVAAHDMDVVALGGRCLPVSTVATLRAVSALVVLAPSQSEYLHEEEGVGRHWWSRTREAVIPNGIAVPALPAPGLGHRVRAELGVPQDAFVIGVVARLSEQKAHEVLLEAVERLRRSHPRTWLLVVGGGARETELRELAERLGVADQTRFLGVRRDVGRLLAAMDVSCLSSVHEAAPISVIESMAAGLPVVATECGALRDMIQSEREGVLVPVGDSERMAQVLAGLADDPERRVRMGAAARARVQAEFTIEQTARGYEHLLQDLVVRR